MFSKQFLKLFLSGSHKNTYFCTKYASYLTNRYKILHFTGVRFFTVDLKNGENQKQTGHLYYYDYLRKNPDSYTYIRDIEQMKTEVNKNPDSFKLLNDFLNNLEDDMNEQLCYIISDFSTCDANEICKKIIFINKITAKNSYKNRKVLDLLQRINSEIWKRQFSPDDIIKMLAVICDSNIKHKFFIRKKMSAKLFKRLNYLSNNQIIQFFYGVSENTEVPENYKYNVILKINKIILDLNKDELGIIAKGMRHSDLSSSNTYIFKAILSKLSNEIENIHSVPLSDACKTLQQMCRPNSESDIVGFQEKLIPHISKFNLEDLIHLANLGSKHKYLNSSFWDIVTEKIKNNNNLKLSFISSVINCMISFSIKDEELLMVGLREAEKCENIENNFKTTTKLLSNLVHYKLYPRNLLEMVLSEKVNFSRNDFNLLFSWWTLYCNVELEKPEYLNYILDQDTRLDIYLKIQSAFSLKNKGYKNGDYFHQITCIKNNLTNIYGQDTTMKTVCLPHFEPGLVLRFNKNLEAQPIPKEFSSNKISYIRKPQDDNYWIFLNVLNYNQYDKKNKLCAYRQTQFRQLESIGYIPVFIPKKKYIMHLNENTVDNFLTDLIQKSLLEKTGNKISSN